MRLSHNQTRNKVEVYVDFLRLAANELIIVEP